MKASTHAIYIAIIIILASVSGCMGYKYFKGKNCPDTVTSTTVDTIKGTAGPYTPVPLNEMVLADTPTAIKWIGQKKSKPVAKIVSASPITDTPATVQDYSLGDIGLDTDYQKSQAKSDPLVIYVDSLTIKSKNGKDTAARVWLQDQLQNGKIVDRQWRYEVYQVNKQTVVYRAQYFGGLSLLGNRDNIAKWVGPKIGMLLKNQKAFLSVAGGVMDKQVYFQTDILFNFGRR